MPDTLTYRKEPIPADVEAVRDIVVSTGFFNQAEVDMAADLVRERLEKGPESGYFFLFAIHDGAIAGYTCYGPITGTQSSFDLYWIAVRDDRRGRGLGRALMERTEALVSGLGGGQIYAETSSREQYGPTRRFYESCGYAVEALVRDFYAPGDSKVIYVKVVGKEF